MKVIAFFDLKPTTDVERFLEWANTRQAGAFQCRLDRMSNFRVFRLIEADNCDRLPRILQLFDWRGTAEDWRGAIRSFQTQADPDLHGVAQEWLSMCENDSVQIMYAADS